jgi:hypothetical protein
MKTTHRYAAHAKRRIQADPGAFMRVINRLEPFSPSELMRLELPIRMSFQALKSGTGTERDFHDIAAAINVTIIRSRDIDPLCEQTATAASDAMMRMWDRNKTTGKWGFDGPALAEVEAAIELHEQLIRLSTPQQMVTAMEKVIAIRMRAGVRA